MSYDPQPGSNPYAAPETDLIFPETGQKIYITGYAGFWRRLAAMFLDSLLMNVVGFVVGLVFGVVIASMGQGGNVGGFGVNSNEITPAQAVLTVGMYVILFVVNLGYFIGMETSASQATFGKMALGIKVCDLQGRRITRGQAFGRYFGKIVSGLILGVGYLMAAFTDKKQALHDMMAGTLVVKAR